MTIHISYLFTKLFVQVVLQHLAAPQEAVVDDALEELRGRRRRQRVPRPEAERHEAAVALGPGEERLIRDLELVRDLGPLGLAHFS